MHSIAVLVGAQDSFWHFACGSNWRRSRAVLAMETAVNPTIIAKYFLDDNDIDTLQKAMKEAPVRLEFTHALLHKSLFQYIQAAFRTKIADAMTKGENALFLVYSNRYQQMIWSDQPGSGSACQLVNAAADLVIGHAGGKELKLHCQLRHFEQIIELTGTKDDILRFKTEDEFLVCLRRLNTRISQFLDAKEVDSFDSDLAVDLTLETSLGTHVRFIVLPTAEGANSGGFSHFWREVQAAVTSSDKYVKNALFEVRKEIDIVSFRDAEGGTVGLKKAGSRALLNGRKQAVKVYTPENVSFVLYIDTASKDIESVINIANDIEHMQQLLAGDTKSLELQRQKRCKIDTFAGNSSRYTGKAAEDDRNCQSVVSDDQNEIYDCTAEIVRNAPRTKAPGSLKDTRRPLSRGLDGHSAKAATQGWKPTHHASVIEEPLVKESLYLDQMANKSVLKKSKKHAQTMLQDDIFENHKIDDFRPSRERSFNKTQQTRFADLIGISNRIDESVFQRHAISRQKDTIPTPIDYNIESDLEVTLPDAISQNVARLFQEKMRRLSQMYEYKFKELAKENRFLKASLQNQSQNVKQLELLYKGKEADERALKDTLDRAEFELSRKTSELTNLIRKAQETQTLLHRAEDRIEILQQEAQQMARKCEIEEIKRHNKETDVTRELTRLTQNCQNLEKEATIHALKERELTAVIDTVKAESQTLRSLLETRDKEDIQRSFEVKNLLVTIDDLKAQLVAKDMHICKLDAEFKERNLKITALEEQGREAERKLSKLTKKELERTDALRKDFESQFKEQQRLIDSQKDRISALTQELSDARSQNQTLEAKTSKYAKLKDNSSVLEKNLAECERLLELKSKRIDELNGTNIERESEVRALRQRAEVLESEIAVLREYRASADQDIRTATVERHELEDHIKSLKSQLESEKLERAALKDAHLFEFAKVQSQITSLTSELTALQTELDRKTTKEAQLRHEITQITSLNEKNRAKAVQRKKECEILNDRLKAAREELNGQEKEAIRTRAEVDSLAKTQEMNYKKVGLMSDIKGLISCYKNLTK